MIAVVCFLLTAVLTLGITVWAARRSVGRSGVYAAGGKITAGQNALAITGDFLSAATIMGSVAIFYTSGLDTALFYIGPLVGMCLLLIFIAGPLRRLGRYTLGDVLAAKMPGRSIRLFTGVSTLILSELYVVAQLVGAGALFSTIFGVSFEVATAIVAALIICYVAFGGMLATTWVQIVKAVLLIGGVSALSILSVVHAGGLGPLYARAQENLTFPIGNFGAFGFDLFSGASMSAALVLGMIGMPHLLVRFLTVPDVKAARRSIFLATFIVAAMLGLLLLAVGPGAVAFVKGVALYEASPGKVIGGSNMIVLHLSSALGGEWLFGLISAVAFSTILAVVAGLTIASAASVAHDIYLAVARHPEAISEKRELLVFRFAAVGATLVAAGLSVLLQNENVALLTILAYGIAASTNVPVLILALYWPRLTRAGAVWGGTVGLATAIAFVFLGPTVSKLMGHAPLFPSDYSTLISTPLAFIVAWAVSLMDKTPKVEAPAAA